MVSQNNITDENFMKTKETIKRAGELAKSFRITKGKDFRLKDVDPNDTLEFTKEADKPRAKEALATVSLPWLSCKTSYTPRTSGPCC
jgi:hypothetical protein